MASLEKQVSKKMFQNGRTTISGQQSKRQIAKSEVSWKSIAVKVRLKDLPALNQRIHLYGYDSLGKLVKDFVEGSFPPITEIVKFRGWTTTCSNLAYKQDLKALSTGPSTS